MSDHTPAPWAEDLAPAVGARSDRVLLGGNPPSRDIRVLSEENFQHARHCVNAHDALVAALEALRDNLRNICCGEAEVMDQASADVMAQSDAALALARGGK